MNNLGDTANGIVIGIVVDLDDPDRLGRVRVRFPHLGTGKKTESTWARLASPMAGKGRGLFFRPEKDDEVLVLFEHNDPRRPYIVGGLWSTADLPPKDDGRTTANNWRLIRSRCGHVIKFDDTKGAETIEVIDKDENCRVVIDAAKKKIRVKCDRGDIEVQTGQGKVTIQATTVEVKSTGAMNIEAGGTLTLKGTTVNIN